MADYSEGGYIPGDGRDTIRAVLREGYIINEATIKKYTRHNLEVFMRGLTDPRED